MNSPFQFIKLHLFHTEPWKIPGRTNLLKNKSLIQVRKIKFSFHAWNYVALTHVTRFSKKENKTKYVSLIYELWKFPWMTFKCNTKKIGYYSYSDLKLKLWMDFLWKASLKIMQRNRKGLFCNTSKLISVWVS